MSGEFMTFEEFEKQASRYSHKAVLRAFYGNSFRPENILDEIELEDYKIKTDALLKKSEEVLDKQRQYSGKSDLESLIKWQECNKEWSAIHKKLDKLSDEFMKRGGK